MPSSVRLRRHRARWRLRLTALASVTAMAMGGLTVLNAPAAFAAGDPLLYTANRAANTVSVLDTVSNTVTGTIPVGNAPSGVSRNAAGTRVFVANSDDNSVSVIDTSTAAVIATVPGFSNPTGVVVNPVLARAYVTNTGANTVSVIDTATDTIFGGPIPVGNGAFRSAVSADGTRLYVSSSAANTVSVIDTSTDAVVATIPVGTTPLGLKTNLAGTRLYVAEQGSNRLTVVDTTTDTVVANIPVGTNPQSLGVSPDGSQVYVAAQGTDSVSVVDTATNSLAATIPVGSNPVAATFSADGTRAYVDDYVDGTVSVIDTATRTVTATVAVGARPYDIAPDPVPAPVVTGVSPATGPLVAGTPVTVTGTGLAGTTAVSFGSAAATGVSCGVTSCTVAAPAGSPGTVDVRVTTDAGTSAVVAADHYTYLDPAPTVTSVSPGTGPTTGGTAVTVTGTGLTGATVSFGPGRPATGVSCTATSCTATAPAAPAGTVDVQATSAHGTSATSPADHYTYTAADLSVALAATGVPGLLGGRIDYTVTVTDHGPSALVSGTVTATLPAPMTASSSDCTSSGGHVSCAIGALAGGASLTRHFSAPVGLLTLGVPYAVTATRTASSPVDLVPGNDSATRNCTVLTSLIISCS